MKKVLMVCHCTAVKGRKKERIKEKEQVQEEKKEKGGACFQDVLCK